MLEAEAWKDINLEKYMNGRAWSRRGLVGKRERDGILGVEI